MFREANERILELKQIFATFTDDPVLVCECGDGKCAEQIAVTPQAYEELRAVPAHFAVLPGHEAPDVSRPAASPTAVPRAPTEEQPYGKQYENDEAAAG